MKVAKTVGQAVEMTIQEVATDARNYLEQAYHAVIGSDAPQEQQDQIVALMGQADAALDAIQNTDALTAGLVDQLTADLRGAANKAKRLAEQLKATQENGNETRDKLAKAQAEIQRLRHEMNTAVDAALQTGINKGFENAQIAYRS